nr:Lrp/AsnC family transcriptional regulator [Prauserella isguenensis]
MDALDRRIVAALQLDGRASWHRIARVLDEPERTVARRGARLLSSGRVAVHGLARRGDMAVLRLRCNPGMLRVAATAMARRDDTTFTYLLTGSADCAAEISCPPHLFESLILDELPGTPGLISCSTNPALRYYRAVHEWQPGLLTADEAAALAPSLPDQPNPSAQPFHKDEALLLRLLADDGRRPGEELATLSGLSEPTVRRRIEAMRGRGRLLVRAVVDPALLGLPIEALLWVKVPPRNVDAVGLALREFSSVRYAVALAGEYQLLVHVVTTDIPSLHEFTTRSGWIDDVDSIETSMIVSAPKRTGVANPALRHRESTATAS